MEHGFARIAVGIPRVTVADCEKNLIEIKTLVDRAEAASVDVLVFPELAITGSTCGDLLFQSTLLQAAERALEELIAYTAGKRPLVAVGLPVMLDAKIWTVAAVVSNGQLLGVVSTESEHPYSLDIILANENVPFGPTSNFSCQNFPALTIGIDSKNPDGLYPMVILSLGADPEQIGKAEVRRNMVTHRSARWPAIYAYAGAGMGESTTDMVFSGHGLIAENGRLLLETERFRQDSHLSYCDVDLDLLQRERLKKPINPNWPPYNYTSHSGGIPFDLPPVSRTLERAIPTNPHLPDDGSIDTHCREIFEIQTAALTQRFRASGVERLIVGVSGGLDSTLALLVAANVFDRLGRDKGDILAVTMPGFGTTSATHTNAVSLMTHLGVTWREISIEDACLRHFAAIGHDPEVHDATYAYAQARERTQILLDLANQVNGLVLGPGNLSELALGFTTYGGDHLSMYAINCGDPKTLVREMVGWLARSGHYGPDLVNTLQDIQKAPISPELLPPDESGETKQRTEELIGPYALHDFFLYYVVRYGFTPAKIVYLAEHAFVGQFDRAAIIKWLEVFYRRFFASQFKRSCLPDGPQMGPVSLSPRGGWSMPSDAAASMWLRELEALASAT
ncbi:MAG: NAD(+) synthase [Oscillospiraceae bacterium]|nr:NAD(+) synthase [Oscillospiraceae bacterium]